MPGYEVSSLCLNFGLPKTPPMKTITKVLLGLLIIIAALFIYAASKPAGYKVERSIEISAPKAVVWQQISLWKNFNNWNPWAKMDTNAVYTYAGNDGQPGSSITWKGNKDMGSGSMKTTVVNAMQSLNADLHFVEPFESKAKIDLRMEGEDGMVKVTWGMSGEQGLIERFFFIFMGSMDKMIGQDYENGLKALKKVCEEGLKNSFERPKEISTIDGFPIFQTTIPGRIYAMIRNKVRFDVMNDSGYMEKTIGQLMTKLAEHKLTMTGTIYAIGYLYDEKNQVMDVGVAVPVASIPAGNMDGFQVVNIPARGAFGTDYYGEYKGTEKAHTALSRYMEQNNIKGDGTWIEEYLTDPGTEKNPANWLTRIYYPLP